jgi:3-dehydroquinate dehydratase II
MPSRILILNGPNLNLLGVREPHIYGTVTLAAVGESCRELAAAIDVALDFRQSNSEGELVEWIQDARESADAIVINPAGFSFYSVAILDALKMFPGPIIELHISNIHARDAVHRHSIMSAGVKAVICGLGPYGYVVALLSAARLLDALPDTLPEPLRIGPL